jgi:hypothetical protein
MMGVLRYADFFYTREKLKRKEKKTQKSKKAKKVTSIKVLNSG